MHLCIIWCTRASTGRREIKRRLFYLPSPTICFVFLREYQHNWFRSSYHRRHLCRTNALHYNNQFSTKNYLRPKLLQQSLRSIWMFHQQKSLIVEVHFSHSFNQEEQVDCFNASFLICSNSNLIRELKRYSTINQGFFTHYLITF